MLAVLFLLSSLFALVTPFNFTDCGSLLGTFSKVTISECDPPTPAACDLQRGSNATLKVQFIPNDNVNGVSAIVHGIIGGIPIPFSLPNPDGCIDSGLKCPLEKGVQYTYVTQLPVLQEYPKVRVIVKWELQSESKKDIICFKLPAKIV